jgi:triosephosphate isomerase
VGESAKEKEFGAQKETVARQLRIALESIEPSQAPHLIIAYEPVWAIGKNGSIVSPEYVLTMSGPIRSVFASIVGTEGASQTRIIYGGSVDECNAPQILLQGNVDGLFIGRAALRAANFAISSSYASRPWRYSHLANDGEPLGFGITTANGCGDVLVPG